MAPVAASLVVALALAGAVDASPALGPGRHAPPSLANTLSTYKRGLHHMLARYYGSAHGLTKPAALVNKRSDSLPAGWTAMGCVSESWDARLLDSFSFSSLENTPVLCIDECAKRGYSLAGTEYGDECYCADAFNGDGGETVDDDVCDTPCAGDSSVMCGNAWYLNLYMYNSTTAGALYCDSTATATVTVTAAGSAATATVTATLSAGELLVNGTTATASLTADVSVATATATGTLSTGDLLVNGTTTTASLGANVTAATATATTLSTSPAVTGATTSSTTASAASATATYTDADDASEWYSLGCAVDSDDRILTGYVEIGIDDLTIDSCLTLCEEQGFTFAGVEYADQCYCGNSVPSTITYKDGGCDMPCSGDSTELCGGGYILDLYELISAASSSNDTTCDVTSATTSATATFIATTTSAATSATTTATVTLSAQSTVTPAATSVPSSSETHYVWVHHMVGNTYPYAESDWASDIAQAAAYGIDGFALNMGVDSWQPARVADAYTAAEASSTGFKLFLSLDMTSLTCATSADAATLVSLVAAHASSSAQATYDDKVIVSTFAGSDCDFGTGSSDAWQTLFVDALADEGIDIYFVPSIFSDVSTFSANTWMDGELNWNSGWPMGDYDIDTDSTDATYQAALGSKSYMPAISPFFFTHFPASTYDKNWIYRSDDWLYCERWEAVIAMRESVQMTEILTWNDYGESSYIGPIAGALPTGSDVWVDGFDHQGLNVLTTYYASAFKNGAYPTIEQDSITMWSRPHPKDATADDSTGIPANWEWTDDNLYAVVLTTGPAVVTLTAGSNTETFAVEAGLTKLKLASATGSMSGSIVRDGETTASYSAGSDFTYTDTPSSYNFNYFVGSSSS
ncbi:hypothetical protein Q5752_006272 [Cryptotrichosporon argae]